MNDNVKAILIVLGVIILFAGSIAYAKFQWTECRKDPDHTFWHCWQVLD